MIFHTKKSGFPCTRFWPRDEVSKATRPKFTTGFSLIELLVALSIIGVLMTIVFASISQSRSYGRDAQVRSHKQTIKLALARMAEFTSGGMYPGTVNQWTCLKTSAGNCFVNSTGVVDAALNSSGLLTYFPGGKYPTPPISKSGEARYDSYVYTPSYLAYFAATSIAGYAGPVLLWWQEKPIPASDCNGSYVVGAGNDAGLYYCYEKLQ